MNYIWSKLSLLEFIKESIDNVVKSDNYIFSDLFAWTWIVWRYFKSLWHKIISNDLQYYSYVLNRSYIWNNETLKFWWLEKDIPELKEAKLIDKNDIVCKYLENIPWKEWYIFSNYSSWGTKTWEFERMYFSDENAKKCDAIREKIEERRNEKKINEDEYFYLLCILVEGIDKVANTASVYWAFLKKLKKSAINPLKMTPTEVILSYKKNEIYNEDINKLIEHTEHDVVYLDPPYNQRQYSWNYHILETIAKNDRPKIHWKTWMRDCSNQKSLYCSRSQVKKAFKELVDKINANYIFLSYNDEWLMSLDDIKGIMSNRGEYWFFTKKYNRFKADKDENREYKKDFVIEYLHYVKIKK